jgi:SAM-dependent methyltransferase
MPLEPDSHPVDLLQTLHLIYSSDDLLILDIRTRDEFDQGHLALSTNIPANTIPDRWYELPDKQVPFSIVVPQQGPLEIDQRNWPTFLKEKSWCIQHILQFDDNLITASLSIGKWLTSSGPHKRILFKPCDLLSSQLGLIEKSVQEFQGHDPDMKLTLHCLDVGCGSGRDVIWLASKKFLDMAQFPSLLSCSPNYNWKVTGIDNWKAAVGRVNEFAARFQVAENVQLHVAAVKDNGNIELKDPSDVCIEKNAFDMILCIRFLERAFLPRIKEYLNVGGILVYSTFVLEENESDTSTEEGIRHGKHSFLYSSPSTFDKILGFNELNEYFNEKEGFRVLMDLRSRTNDGRPLHNIIAQRIT